MELIRELCWSVEIFCILNVKSEIWSQFRKDDDPNRKLAAKCFLGNTCQQSGKTYLSHLRGQRFCFHIEIKGQNYPCQSVPNLHIGKIEHC